MPHNGPVLPPEHGRAADDLQTLAGWINKQTCAVVGDGR